MSASGVADERVGNFDSTAAAGSAAAVTAAEVSTAVAADIRDR